MTSNTVKHPKVSVVMPVFNVGKYLSVALDSLINQTFKDFEVIIIEDGSTDETIQILKNIKDKRIKVLYNHKNLGLPKSLNKGIMASVGEYIVRFDGDDICRKDRLDNQVKFLDQHLDYIVVGSNSEDINSEGKKIGETIMPKSDKEIRKLKYRKNFMIHPTVMIRAVALKNTGGYRIFFKGGAEEYDLWLRLLEKGKFHNLSEKLIQRRIHKSAFTNRQKFKRVEIYALLARFINLPIIRSIGLDGSIGIFTFLLYRYWLISLLFTNRSVPPEPDDVYHYLSSATHIFRIDNFEDYRLFSYSLWINFLKLVSGLNYEGAFLLNFYLGTLILFIVLVYFVRSLTKNTLYRIILLIFLAQFNGSGAYHGFYWIVPSFYQLVTFFILLTIIISKNKVNKAFLIGISILFTIIHPSSLIISPIFFLIPIFSRFILKEKNSTNSWWVFTTIIVSYLIYSLVGMRYPLQGNTLIAPSETINLITVLFSGQLISSSWVITQREYFSILFFHPISILGFLICLILTWKFTSKKIVIIYLSILLISILANLHPYGYRVLEFLWPITFLIFGFGTISLYQLISEMINKSLSNLMVFGVTSCFVIAATSMSIIWINSINSKKNYDWDRSCAVKLNQLSKDKVYFSDWDNLYAFRTFGFPTEKGLSLTKDNIDTASVIVVSTPSSLNYTDRTNYISSFVLSNITRKTPYPIIKIADHVWYQEMIDKSKFLDFRTTIDCGYFKIQSRQR